MLDIDAFLDVNELTFQRQGIKLPYTRSYVKRLFSACQANEAGCIFLARGKDGRMQAIYWYGMSIVLTTFWVVGIRNW